MTLYDIIVGKNREFSQSFQFRKHILPNQKTLGQTATEKESR